ncbi:hypothetical protein L202_07187 [Cryptococcus amylolentus CBS 6039]|uniref:Conserved oligomeric Golgi complex subunit 7 n=1 Tax=Cryptococcus amylolentus CBS 6039 TaxID=1295533 RepID=A0A1E3HFI5_9TREE|nr:hypothetical protein L202_07187 [Cryptococcus amylolentus CBS 6039]ODN74885.1 hypothetical protein L202_07187 [Cryptococcus amylolentus CBS 6039]
MSSPTPNGEPYQPIAASTSSLESLATRLDASVSPTSFLNDLFAPLLPPPLPLSQQPTPPALPPIDQSLQDLLTRLSMLSQDTAGEIETVMGDVGRTVPRLGYDLQFMRESASGLAVGLGMVQERVARQADWEPVEKKGKKEDDSEAVKTYRALEKLTHLDKLKGRLESARDTLREAESWSTLESEITTLIGEKEYAKAGQRLAEANRSMVVFKNVPAEWEERKRLLVSLGDELERAAGEALREALRKGDEGLEQVRGFWEVFEDMDRDDEFRKWYFNEKGRGVLDLWKGAVLEEGAVDASRFTTFLPQFYSLLLQTLTSEISSIPLVFPPDQAPSTLTAFFQSTLDALHPPFSNRLSSVADHHGDAALGELVKSWEATVELGKGVQGLVDKIVLNTQGGLLSGGLEVDSPSPLATTSPNALVSPNNHRRSPSHAVGMARTSSHTKRHHSISRRFSRAPTASFDTSSPGTVNDAWETTLYEPFLDWQSSYPSLEAKYLSVEFEKMASVWAREGRRDGKSVVGEMVKRGEGVWEKAREAGERCSAFTLGYGARGLVEAVDMSLKKVYDDQRRYLLDLAKSQAAAHSKDKGDELDFEGGLEDWASFQTGLHVLEACKRLAEKLAHVEEEMGRTISEYGSNLGAKRESWGVGKKVTWGAVSLLQQSTLNTAELHTLVSSPTSPLFPQSRASLITTIQSCQENLQSTILSPLLSQLSTYPTLSVWQKEPAKSKSGFDLPEFSLSPTGIISRVSEGLLDLLRVFEVYGKEEGVGWSLGTLPFTPPGSHPSGLGEAPTLEIIQTTWLSSLSLSLLSHFTSTILPGISTLTTPGQAQLKEDLGYLENAVRALDVEWEELGIWEKGVGLDEAGWRGAMKEVRAGKEKEKEKDKERREAGKAEEILRRIGRMRGWRLV